MRKPGEQTQANETAKELQNSDAKQGTDTAIQEVSS